MEKKIIFHIDVNSAFLSWESVYRLEERKRLEEESMDFFCGRKETAGLGREVKNKEILDLRTIPAAVGGDISKRRGVILAKSIPAKKYGVRTGESIVEAVRKCPDLLIVPPRHDMYKEKSRSFLNILREYSPNVEQYSIDEAFMDMSGTQLLFGPPLEAAKKIKDRIFNELGFTVNVGVSTNKLLAKMASDFKKPDLVHTLFPEEIEKKMWGLPVSELFFVGRATEKKLNSLGIRKIGELANTDPEILKYHLKKHGEMIWNFANGIDVSLVEREPAEHKGYGNSTTIPFDVTEETTAKMILLSLTETVASRLREKQVKAGQVSVKIRDFELHDCSHQMLLENPTNLTTELHHAACLLFDELWNGTPIRLLGVSTGRIVESREARQYHLFDTTDYEKLEKLDQAVDQIRSRFGMNAIKRASFLNVDEGSPSEENSGKEGR